MGQIISFFTENLPAIVLGIAGTALAGKIYTLLLANFWPDKLILSLIQKLDDDYLDKFKAKHPEAGKKLEEKVIGSLKEAIEIIKN